MKAILKNTVTGQTIPVTSTTESASSYGQAVWVDADNNPYCAVGLPNPIYEVVSATIEDRESLGQMLRNLRISKGYSIRTLADMCDMSKSTIVSVEGGRFAASIDIIARILKELNATMTIQP